MQRAGFYALQGVDRQPRQVGGGKGPLEIPEAAFFFQQALRIAHGAVEEDAHAQSQVVDQAAVQFGYFLHAGL